MQYEKNSIRNKILAIRAQVQNKVQKDAIITSKVLALSEVRNAKRICIYESFPQEVDTKEIIIELKKQNKIILPPDPPPNNIDVYIIPGVVFDRQGNRIGRGGGYYDRLLADVTAPIIGLAYRCQIVSRLTPELYDIPVSILIHE